MSNTIDNSEPTAFDGLSRPAKVTINIVAGTIVAGALTFAATQDAFKAVKAKMTRTKK